MLHPQAVTGKSLVAGQHLSADDPLLTSEDLVGEILLTFDRLLPAYVCAVADDPLPFLNRRIGRECESETDRIESFRRVTSLSDAWLRRALDLIGLKRQLILQGVPGTGKTFVARHLSRLLTHGRVVATGQMRETLGFQPRYTTAETFADFVRAQATGLISNQTSPPFCVNTGSGCLRGASPLAGT